MNLIINKYSIVITDNDNIIYLNNTINFNSYKEIILENNNCNFIKNDSFIYDIINEITKISITELNNLNQLKIINLYNIDEININQCNNLKLQNIILNGLNHFKIKIYY